ncbi:hypothetical protein DL95DRAFT_521748 [Leptodontidium sp. 2 PMI_412]|nr:hypothetical protein DL95DRAFT_521748 [Leptodontidium sp. 2 PMI_412]
MLPRANIFQDQSQKSVFLSALDEQHTLHSYEAFVSNCLPVLANALQQRKPHHRQRSIGHTRKKPVRVSKASSESSGPTGTRRSLRNKKPDTPPSEFITMSTMHPRAKSTSGPFSPS